MPQISVGQLYYNNLIVLKVYVAIVSLIDVLYDYVYKVSTIFYPTRNYFQYPAGINSFDRPSINSSQV